MIFDWTLTYSGVSALLFENSGTLEYQTTINQVTIHSIAASGSTPGDQTIHLLYKGVSGTMDTEVRTPDHWTFIRNDELAGTPCSTYIIYSIRDQYDAQLPYNVPVNEKFTTGVVPDMANNWSLGTEGSAIMPPGEMSDHMGNNPGATGAGDTPADLFPTDASAGVKVCHLSGEWRVGSLEKGRGVQVTSTHWAGSSTCKWQFYRGYGRHE